MVLVNLESCVCFIFSHQTEIVCNPCEPDAVESTTPKSIGSQTDRAIISENRSVERFEMEREDIYPRMCSVIARLESSISQLDAELQIARSEVVREKNLRVSLQGSIANLEIELQKKNETMITSKDEEATKNVSNAIEKEEYRKEPTIYVNKEEVKEGMSDDSEKEEIISLNNKIRELTHEIVNHQNKLDSISKKYFALEESFEKQHRINLSNEAVIEALRKELNQLSTNADAAYLVEMDLRSENSLLLWQDEKREQEISSLRYEIECLQRRLGSRRERDERNVKQLEDIIAEMKAKDYQNQLEISNLKFKLVASLNSKYS